MAVASASKSRSESPDMPARLPTGETEHPRSLLDPLPKP